MSEILEVPNTWKSGAITQKGLGLLAKLITGHTLDITRAVTGAGFVDPELLQEQTEVLEPMQEMTNAGNDLQSGKLPGGGQMLHFM